MRKRFPKAKCRRGCIKGLAGPKAKFELTGVKTHIPVKVKQSHYRPEVPRGFQEVKVPRLRDNGPGWW